MTPFVENVTFVLSIGTLLLQIFVVMVLVFYFLKKKVNFIELFAPLMVFIIVLASVVSSLFYSDYAGFPPCAFCWYQRIVMYPDILILAVGYFKRTVAAMSHAMDHVLWMSVVGAVLSGYQYFGQMFNESALPCGIDAVSCATRQFVSFGFITIPMMALTGFVAIIVLCLYYNRFSSSKAAANV